jgi:site-specific recombinase XerD
MKASASRKVAVLPDPSVDPWPTLWQSFERSMRADDKSPRTLEIYADGGRIFYDFMRERNLPTDPAAIQKQHVEDFLIWLRAERLAKPATVRARFSCLRRFFNWCIEEGEIEHSPMQRMHGPKVEEEAPQVLSEDEQRQLLNACKGEDFEDRRDTALLRLMLDAGLRRGEVAGIKLEDLDLDGRVVKILGKGRRPGVAFFGVKTARDLDRYLRIRPRHLHADLPELWLSQKGALTGDGIHHLIAQRARQARINRPIHPHLTRHSWAHALKSAGASDEDVMSLGRWRDPKMMRRYGASAAIARAQETHRRLSPGDRL